MIVSKTIHKYPNPTTRLLNVNLEPATSYPSVSQGSVRLTHLEGGGLSLKPDSKQSGFRSLVSRAAFGCTSRYIHLPPAYLACPAFATR